MALSKKRQKEIEALKKKHTEAELIELAHEVTPDESFKPSIYNTKAELALYILDRQDQIAKEQKAARKQEEANTGGAPGTPSPDAIQVADPDEEEEDSEENAEEESTEAETSSAPEGKIWKFTKNINPNQPVELPDGSKVLIRDLPEGILLVNNSKVRDYLRERAGKYNLVEI